MKSKKTCVFLFVIFTVFDFKTEETRLINALKRFQPVGFVKLVRVNMY